MCATREDRVGRPSIAENVGRRSVMIAAASTMMAMALPVRAELGIGVAGVSASTLETNNSIDLFNFHTHDHFDGVYRTAIGPLPDAMQEISHLLRDHHVDAMIPIDVRLIDILSLFARRLEGVGHGSTALTIFSGYRTPQTNAILASLSSRVAINSFHMQGRAVDLRVDGFELRRLYEMAVALRAGGVGYYEGSHIHLDSGPFRTWEYGGGQDTMEQVRASPEEVRRRLGRRLGDRPSVSAATADVPEDAAASRQEIGHGVASPADHRQVWRNDSTAGLGATGVGSGGLVGLGRTWP